MRVRGSGARGQVWEARGGGGRGNFSAAMLAIGWAWPAAGERRTRESGPSLHIAHLRLDAVPLYYSISLNCGGFGVKYTERKVKP